MKKFLSLAMVIAMVLSFAVIPASASADATMTLAITGDNGEVGDMLTFTCTITGVTEIYNWQCIFDYNSDVLVPYSNAYSCEVTGTDALYALDSHVLDATTTGLPKKYYGNTGVSDENGRFTVYATTAGGAAGKVVPVSADGYVVFTASFKRTATGDINVAYATGTNAPGVKVSSDDTAAPSSAISYTAPSAGTPVVAPSTSTPGDVSDFTDTITFPTKAEQGAETSSTYTKKIAVFAKNNTGAELAAGSYGIEIGDFYYAGLSTVAANSYWRIVLVSTDDNRLTENSYSYTAVMAGATSATGTATPSN